MTTNFPNLGKKMNIQMTTRDSLYIYGHAQAGKKKKEEWKNLFHANKNQKKAGVVTLISHKIDLSQKL